RVGQRQRLDQRPQPRGALLTARHVRLGMLAGVLAVVQQHQVVFAHVAHDTVPARGASTWRAFLTARHTLCLTAVVSRPRASSISFTERPSKWRSTKAARSRALIVAV